MGGEDSRCSIWLDRSAADHGHEPVRIALATSHSLEEIFRAEWPRLVATLVRDFGDIELAEDCAQEAFAEASRRWIDHSEPESSPGSLPTRPGAWLTTTARRKALDRLRRSSNLDKKFALLDAEPETINGIDARGLLDDQLALLLGCCHPALNLEAQVALTLRLVCGLTTKQIARAFLVDEPAMGKRLTRAKVKIRTANIPFGPVDRSVLDDRVDAARHVIYLIFTEGHASASDEQFVRGDLCDEALWLAWLLAQLVSDDTESHGLHALILFTDARRATRLDPDGIPILLEDQDRSRWDREKIEDGLRALARARDLGALGPFGIQAIVASFHATAPSFEATEWSRIVRMYDLLMTVDASPVVALNRAVALSFSESPEAGLDAIEPLSETLGGYVYLHSTAADLLRRSGRHAEARDRYQRALDCEPPPAERAFLERRLAQADPEGR